MLCLFLRAQTVAECVVFARELANDRADAVNPKTLEAVAKSVAATHKLKVCGLVFAVRWSCVALRSAR